MNPDFNFIFRTAGGDSVLQILMLYLYFNSYSYNIAILLE